MIVYNYYYLISLKSAIRQREYYSQTAEYYSIYDRKTVILVNYKNKTIQYKRYTPLISSIYTNIHNILKIYSKEVINSKYFVVDYKAVKPYYNKPIPAVFNFVNQYRNWIYWYIKPKNKIKVYYHVKLNFNDYQNTIKINTYHQIYFRELKYPIFISRYIEIPFVEFNPIFEKILVEYKVKIDFNNYKNIYSIITENKYKPLYYFNRRPVYKSYITINKYKNIFLISSKIYNGNLSPKKYKYLKPIIFYFPKLRPQYIYKSPYYHKSLFTGQHIQNNYITQHPYYLRWRLYNNSNFVDYDFKVGFTNINGNLIKTFYNLKYTCELQKIKENKILSIYKIKINDFKYIPTRYTFKIKKYYSLRREPHFKVKTIYFYTLNRYNYIYKQSRYKIKIYPNYKLKSVENNFISNAYKVRFISKYLLKAIKQSTNDNTQFNLKYDYLPYYIRSIYINTFINLKSSNFYHNRVVWTFRELSFNLTYKYRYYFKDQNLYTVKLNIKIKDLQFYIKTLYFKIPKHQVKCLYLSPNINILERYFTPISFFYQFNFNLKYYSFNPLKFIFYKDLTFSIYKYFNNLNINFTGVIFSPPFRVKYYFIKTLSQRLDYHYLFNIEINSSYNHYYNHLYWITINTEYKFKKLPYDNKIFYTNIYVKFDKKFNIENYYKSGPYNTNIKIKYVKLLNFNYFYKDYNGGFKYKKIDDEFIKYVYTITFLKVEIPQINNGRYGIGKVSVYRDNNERLNDKPVISKNYESSQVKSHYSVKKISLYDVLVLPKIEDIYFTSSFFYLISNKDDSHLDKPFITRDINLDIKIKNLTDYSKSTYKNDFTLIEDSSYYFTLNKFSELL